MEGQNLAIEYRYADNRHDRLPALADDLVRRQVAAIVCNGDAALAAKAATAIIPIVFVTGDDPVRQASSPTSGGRTGNLTGVTFFGGGQLGEKRVELLRDLLPNAVVIAVLMDPHSLSSDADARDAEAAARALGRQIVVAKATAEGEFEAAFAKFVQAGANALSVGGGASFDSRRQMIVALAERHALPAIYPTRNFVADGGLMSYAASITGAYRQAGAYVARILKGAKPAELPVLQPTAFELAVNMKAVTTLGLKIPPSILLRADEVIE